MQLTVIVPTFNERNNIPALVNRLESALSGVDAGIVFVDDSSDDTPEVIRAQQTSLPVSVIHREPQDRVGGLSGAVLTGFRAARTQYCAVIDGDLQHPPELLPVLLQRAVRDKLDVVSASRFLPGGDAGGLSSGLRLLVSRMCILLCRLLFPRKLRHCTDPMTGYFVVRLGAVDLDVLQPRGFKILLEVLTRGSGVDLAAAEEPLVFAARAADESKASAAQGRALIAQLVNLRFTRRRPVRRDNVVTLRPAQQAGRAGAEARSVELSAQPAAPGR